MGAVSAGETEVATEGSASTNKTIHEAERSRYPAPPPDGIREEAGQQRLDRWLLCSHTCIKYNKAEGSYRTCILDYN